MQSKTNYAFIDSQNLNLGVNKQKWKLDFLKFRKFLRDEYNVGKAFLFIGFIEGNESLYSNLKRFGYTVIFKPTLESGKDTEDAKVKGNVDAELVMHAMIEMSNYDKAVIVSGDGDFYSLIEYLDKKNRLLKIVVPNSRYSTLLKKFEKYIVNLNEYRGWLRMITRRKKVQSAQSTL